MPLDISPALARLLRGPCSIIELADACRLPPSLSQNPPSLTGSRWRELHDALSADPAVVVEESPHPGETRRYRLRHPGECASVSPIRRDPGEPAAS